MAIVIIKDINIIRYDFYCHSQLLLGCRDCRVSQLIWNLDIHAPQRINPNDFSHSCCHEFDTFGLWWKASTAIGWIAWSLAQISMVPRGWILMTLVMPWPLIYCHQQVSFHLTSKISLHPDRLVQTQILMVLRHCSLMTLMKPLTILWIAMKYSTDTNVPLRKTCDEFDDPLIFNRWLDGSAYVHSSFCQSQ